MALRLCAKTGDQRSYTPSEVVPQQHADSLRFRIEHSTLTILDQARGRIISKVAVNPLGMQARHAGCI